MEKIRTKIYKIFHKENIVENVTEIMDKLISENKINEFMSFDAVCTALLIYLSNSHKIFGSLLSKKYLYDLEFFIKDKKVGQLDKTSGSIKELTEKIEDILKGRIEYVYVSSIEDKYFVGIKFNSSVYALLEDTDINKYKIPYYFVIKGLDYDIEDYEFNGIFFEFTRKEITESYQELIDHLKKIKLPLSIIDEELIGSSSFTNIYYVYIYLEHSNAWPEENEAIKYAKTAFYLEIFKKSKFRSLVEKEHVILKYRKLYFRIQIIIKQDKKVDYNLKKNLYRIIEKKSENFKNHLEMIKLYLSKHGFYPVYFNDFIVNVISLIVDEDIISPSKFFDNFLRFNYDFEFKTFDLGSLQLKRSDCKRFSVSYGLENLFVNIPDKIIVKRLKSLNRKVLESKIPLFSYNLRLNTDKLLTPNFRDFDFVFSYDRRGEGFKKIKYKKTENIHKNGAERINVSLDLLGTPCYTNIITFDLLKSSFIFFSETNKLLMVKCKSKDDVELLRLYLTTITNFNYIFINS